MVRKQRFDPSDVSTSGRRIRLMRLTRELSQEALARLVLVTQPAVSQWENDVWLPDPATQKRLCDALDCQRAFLFGPGFDGVFPEYAGRVSA